MVVAPPATVVATVVALFSFSSTPLLTDSIAFSDFSLQSCAVDVTRSVMVDTDSMEWSNILPPAVEPFAAVVEKGRVVVVVPGKNGTKTSGPINEVKMVGSTVSFDEASVISTFLFFPKVVDVGAAVRLVVRVGPVV